jgi:hypothetical protein
MTAPEHARGRSRRFRRGVTGLAAAAVLLSSIAGATPATADEPAGSSVVVPPDGAIVGAAGVTAPAEVAIAGTVAVGQTVSAVPGEWSPTGTTLTYQWQSDGQDLPGATASNLLVGPDLLGTELSVTVTGTAPDSSQDQRISAAVPVLAGTFTASPRPVISGTSRVGATLVAAAGAWSPAATFAYQWSAGGVEVVGATAAQYVPEPADQGKPLTVTVTGTAQGYQNAARTSAPTVPVTGAPFSATPQPTVTGTPRVGAPLTVQPGAWTPNATFSYQWSANGTPITGAITPRYTPTAGDLGARLTVRVTGSAPGYASTARTSAPTGAVLSGVFTTAPTPTLSVTPRVAASVGVRPGTWSPGATLSYQWKLDGRAIAGATRSTYTPTGADFGHQLTVTVTGRRPGYTGTAKSSAPAKIAPGFFTSAPTPTLSGSTTVGSSLTVRPGTWSPSASLTYRWYRDGVRIAGAAAASYRLVAADRGHHISVGVVGSRAGWATTTRTSKETAQVVAPFQDAARPRITGTTKVGSTLRASVPAWTPIATFSYQWKRDGVVISGATGSSHRLTTADYRHTLTVTVTGRRSSYVTTSRTSAATVAVAAPSPTITRDGTYAVGSDIKAGTYISSGGDWCYWERRSDAGDSLDGILANDLGYGQRIVTIAASDAYFTTKDCGKWTLLYGTPKSSAADGVHAVGVQLKPGLYTAPGSWDGCYWARLSGFSGLLGDIEENDFTWGDQPYVRIYSFDVGFESSGCGTWTRVSS